jgi:hypothetical protein
MTTLHRHTAIQSGNTQTRNLTIKIPNWAWNSFEPYDLSLTHRVTRSTTSTGIRAKAKLTAAKEGHGRSAKPMFDDLVLEKKPAASSTQHWGCNIKLWAFHHGGPKRAVKGVMQNQITYESPCLLLTCANCWKWHTRLMRLRNSPGELPRKDPLSADGVDIEPISPEIDPRILNNTWHYYQSRRGSTNSTSPAPPETIKTPMLTPVKQSFASNTLHQDVYLPHQHGIISDLLDQKYNILLPTSLVNQTISAAPVRTRWRSTPRQGQTVRLSFPSDEGKQKFKLLMCRREKKLKKRSYDQAYRARLKLKMEQVSGDRS